MPEDLEGLEESSDFSAHSLEINQAEPDAVQRGNPPQVFFLQLLCSNVKKHIDIGLGLSNVKKHIDIGASGLLRFCLFRSSGALLFSRNLLKP